jgi:hypothetical protein
VYAAPRVRPFTPQFYISGLKAQRLISYNKYRADLRGHEFICLFFPGQPTYEKVNEELFLDKPLHVILNKSKLAYRIYVLPIANKEFKKIFPWLVE